MNQKICIVGMGNMGTSIRDAICSKNLFDVVECNHEDDANKLLKDCDVFVLCMKPQDFGEFAKSITIDLSDKLCISIMAGISLSKLKMGLAMLRIVRVMPNLPLKVGTALSGWIASEEVRTEEKKTVQILLNSFGEEVELDNEEKINAITAISGSGPAYFFLMTEMLEKVALKYGFSAEEATRISNKTFLGSAKLLESVDGDAKELLRNVMSKGGTTEAALRHLFAKKCDESFFEAVDMARKRAEELNE